MKHFSALGVDFVLFFLTVSISANVIDPRWARKTEEIAGRITLAPEVLGPRQAADSRTCGDISGNPASLNLCASTHICLWYTSTGFPGQMLNFFVRACRDEAMSMIRKLTNAAKVISLIAEPFITLQHQTLRWNLAR
ncbi:hypothetical protein K432DRAFT_427151 [Lepidopterella palustris CBS 459.81]|uniref:Uncharacterized protein n=1 Tax=Lepidopterella palustris CBS 459.81 TaxID=1314670 RepID=A0A8E2JE24_9PEZI|nr:hypothetical protein K432DRAFT_427151 [Lepidopterella palustris CBS 459.81]